MSETVELPNVMRKCAACGDGGMKPTRAVLGGGWGGAGVRHVYVCSACQAQAVIENARSRMVSGVTGFFLMGAGAALLLVVPTLGGFVVGLLGVFLGGWGIVGGFLAVELRHPVTGELPETQVVEVEESLADTPEEKKREAKRNKIAALVIWAIVGGTAVIIVWDLIQ